MRPGPWLVVLGLLAAPTGSGGGECTDEQAEVTEQALGAVIDQLKANPGQAGAWEQLLLTVRRHRVCDEEELADLFSQAVCRQLAQSWKDAPAIARSVRRDASLQLFLLAHLDENCAPADLEKIQKNAAARCPRYGKALCAAITARAQQVLEDRPGRARDE